MLVFNPQSSDFDFINGKILLIDKPLGWTSFDVVNKIRYKISRGIYKRKRIKVGHAGTLDPLATGLLILCTGKYTKNIEQLQGEDKIYSGTFFLGATTPSYDRETEVDQEFSINHLTDQKLQETCKQFIGKISQVPPVFSAIKVKGERAYQYARKDQELKLNAREVSINDFEITKIDLPMVDFQVSCSKGTYIRSLANDFGKALSSGAYLHTLRRTHIGKFSIDQALSIEELIQSIDSYINQLEGE